MTDYEFAIDYLKKVETRHKDYFENCRLSILDCVMIILDGLPSVHVFNEELPVEIRQDIEMMFWIG
ncbi:hypothetical protein KXD93_15545 [Mucilaginibacter sp. BJC16-A38]|uniref:hypothetical protein n=1 Tax=Mucilaginibacter phenanthrenivorans TaxID=1234842 RepID=UPI0021583265|nr:hypothetical protein [Mucilaginibacter phenanthrenivorans]MCR8559070.1 hypothetical protein [Mucilaginibacter phenanthrenivorans]